MKFSFFNKSGCCGGGKTKLQSTGYAIDATNPIVSLTQALDRFYTNYRVPAVEIILTDEELSILQRGLPAGELSLINGILFVRKMQVVLVKAM